MLHGFRFKFGLTFRGVPLTWTIEIEYCHRLFAGPKPLKLQGGFTGPRNTGDLGATISLKKCKTRNFELTCSSWACRLSQIKCSERAHTDTTTYTCGKTLFPSYPQFFVCSMVLCCQVVCLITVVALINTIFRCYLNQADYIRVLRSFQNVNMNPATNTQS